MKSGVTHPRVNGAARMSFRGPVDGLLGGGAIRPSSLLRADGAVTQPKLSGNVM
jgi:hypothetical protein